MKCYMGVDIGTSSAKFMLVDARGEVMGTHSVSYDCDAPQSGWAEIPPERWMSAVEEGATALLSPLDEEQRRSLAGIGVTGQMHTTVFLDADGRSIRSAILWNDTRTLPLLAKLRQSADAIPHGSGIMQILSTGSPALNLLWLKREEPEHFARLRTFLIGPDYIVHALTGAAGTDYCEASTSSLYDFRTHTWSEEMRALLGLSADIYPVIRGSGISVGTLRAEIAARWGLPEGIPVVAGTGDNAAAAYANDVARADGGAILSLGTSGVLAFRRAAPDFSHKGKHIVFSVDGVHRSLLVQGVVQSAGRAMQWWQERILLQSDYARELAGVDVDTLGERMLLFYPHMMGDKTIYADMNLRGAFLGLSDRTTRADMQIAVMEGISFAVKELVQAMEIAPEQLNPLCVTGGGAKSALWMQMLADILETPVIRAEAERSAVYGAALLAGGLCSPPTDGEQFCPRARNAGLYRRGFQRYRRIHHAMQEIFQEDANSASI